MDNSLTNFIDSATNFLILIPRNPSLDETAAGLSLHLALKSRKPSVISCPSPILVNLNRLVGVNEIAREIGNRNLTIKFKNYEASSIEKVSYDIINREFNLTVIPKNGFKAPTRDQMEVGFSGVSADTVILVGGGDDSEFPALDTDDLSAAKVVHVGTKPFSSRRDVLSFDKPASSVSELVAVFLKNTGFDIDSDMATNLVMGMEDQSKGFSGREVTPETFEIFAYLLRKGGRRDMKISPVINFPPGSIPTQPYNVPLVRPAPTSSGVPTTAPYIPLETDAHDSQGTNESELDINPPDDWLQPKVFKGSSTNQPASYNENKG